VPATNAFKRGLFGRDADAGDAFVWPVLG